MWQISVFGGQNRKLHFRTEKVYVRGLAGGAFRGCPQIAFVRQKYLWFCLVLCYVLYSIITCSFIKYRPSDATKLQQFYVLLYFCIFDPSFIFSILCFFFIRSSGFGLLHQLDLEALQRVFDKKKAPKNAPKYVPFRKINTPPPPQKN